MNLDKVAWQPCNPAVGGPAKSQLVHEARTPRRAVR
jgi:tRNA uridine 5-carboxymethylaminomethyl modification enzyme